jgi:type VI secretion system protein VasG
MTEISRVALFGKLNTLCYRAVESSTVFCKLRGNPYVEMAHWLHQILQAVDSDLVRIIRHFELDSAALAADMTASLDRLPRGATSLTDLSSQVEESVERAWVYGTLLFGESQVRSGHLIVGMLKTAGLRRVLHAISPQFARLRADDLVDAFSAVLADSPESGLAAMDGFVAGGAPGEDVGAIAPAAMGKQEALRRYTVDLTEQARSGKMDPIVGRDDEIRQVVDILMRRRQNNPILVGEAGVGKTAVVEGFAQRIARGDVPPSLKDVELRSLDIGLLQAGASMKGEFEQRLRSVIDDVQASVKPVILFIDETHALVGAGGNVGTGDAANLLKPALARGTLRTIGATTFAEYKKHIEKDPALTRRFQAVQVDEPTEERAILMMRGVASTMEKHHKVQILDEALEASVRLAHRYIPARQLPDKSVSLLDTACARVAISLHATPAEIDDCRKRIDALQTELAIIDREDSIGVEVTERAQLAGTQLESEQARLANLSTRWDEERLLVDELLALRAQLRDGRNPVDNPVDDPAGIPDAEPDRESLLVQLRAVQEKLSALQGERPMMHTIVDYQTVASVVGDWTGVPVGSMAKNEMETVLNIASQLSRRVIGQDHAMEMIARRIQTSRAGLDDPGKPVGVFLLAGTSGVGKTETALALAEALYGGEQNLITINMSEFQEAHTVSTLKGAPPGYVGYGEGGVLTEAVRRKPYSVVLLDEVEKAHPDVHEVFYQVFDKGYMEDGEGRFIDFKNTLILLTTNAGTDLIASMCRQSDPTPDLLTKALRAPLLEIFPAALLGRMVTIPYYPLSDLMLGQIVRLQLDRIAKRVQARYRIPFSCSDAIVDLIVSRCTESESGGRMINTILTNTMLPDLSREFLVRTLESRPAAGVCVGVRDGGFDYAFDEPASASPAAHG